MSTLKFSDVECAHPLYKGRRMVCVCFKKIEICIYIYIEIWKDIDIEIDKNTYIMDIKIHLHVIYVNNIELVMHSHTPQVSTGTQALLFLSA